MKLIGAGARHDIGSRTGAVAKFGTRGVGEDSNIPAIASTGGSRTKPPSNAIEIVRAIDKEIV